MRCFTLRRLAECILDSEVPYPLISLVELEPLWELPLHLSYRLQELVEHRTCLLQVLLRRKLALHRRKKRLCRFRARRIGHVARWGDEKLFGGEMAAPVEELVPERHPVLLYEDLEARHCSVERVQAELGQRGQLRGPIPAIGAMDEHM